MYKRKRAGNTITRKINSTKDTAAKADKNHYISNSYLEGFIPIDTEYFTASVAVLQNNVSAIQDNVLNLQDNVFSLQTNVSDLQTNVSDLQNNVSDLRNNVSDLQNNFSDLQNNVSALQNNVTTLQSSVTNINLHLENVTDRNIQLLAENYVPAARRYENSSAITEALQRDVSLLKQVVARHSEQLQKLA